MTTDHPSRAALPAAVLFDMDGTLVDTEGHWLDAEREVMRRLGSDWTAEDQVLCLGGPLERVAHHMRSRSGSDLPIAEIGRLLLEAMEQRLRQHDLVWRPGARSLLIECHELEVPTALVSASWARLIHAVSERMTADLGREPFTVVVAGDAVSRSKPHPEPYWMASTALGFAPHECLALEDSPTGVTSARDAGCRVVAVPHVADLSHLGTALTDSLEHTSVAALWALASLHRPGG